MEGEKKTFLSKNSKERAVQKVKGKKRPVRDGRSSVTDHVAAKGHRACFSATSFHLER